MKRTLLKLITNVNGLTRDLFYMLFELPELNIAETVPNTDNTLFSSCPSGEGAGTRKSFRERASAFGGAEEEALRVGRSSLRGNRGNDTVEPSCHHVAKTQQACARQETHAGPETQHTTQNHGTGRQERGVLYVKVFAEPVDNEPSCLFSSIRYSLSDARVEE